MESVASAETLDTQKPQGVVTQKTTILKLSAVDGWKLISYTSNQ
jgi:hypothetical protein